MKIKKMKNLRGIIFQYCFVVLSVPRSVLCPKKNQFGIILIISGVDGKLNSCFRRNEKGREKGKN